jgi:hypothetical protein
MPSPVRGVTAPKGAPPPVRSIAAAPATGERARAGGR